MAKNRYKSRIFLEKCFSSKHFRLKKAIDYLNKNIYIDGEFVKSVKYKYTDKGINILLQGEFQKVDVLKNTYNASKYTLYLISTELCKNNVFTLNKEYDNIFILKDPDNIEMSFNSTAKVCERINLKIRLYKTIYDYEIEETKLREMTTNESDFNPLPAIYSS